MNKNRSYLINYITDSAGISKSKAKLALQTLLDTIKAELIKQEKLSIAGLGVFDTKISKPRRYKNIRTGEVCQTCPKRVPIFRPSSSFKNNLNKLDANGKEQTNSGRRCYVEDDTNCKVFISKPNPNQTDNLRIDFTPINTLVNHEDFPIVLMPQKNSFLKLPRYGRSDVRGYKEAEFLEKLKESDLPLDISVDRHLSVPGRTFPYEPDFVLYKHELGLYIDLEIDEPYDGFSRILTHVKDGADDIRDRFFVESGWIVVRFAEHQIHTNPDGCIRFIRHIINAILENQLNAKLLDCVGLESKWTANQAIIWERNLYREKYLGIQSFTRTTRSIKVICRDVSEKIDVNIPRTSIHSVPKAEVGKTLTNSSKISSQKSLPVLFDEKTHIYYPSDDTTGNSDYISVTTLIDQFFPYFDIDAYIQKKILETGQTEEEIRKELSEPADRGTRMHKDIENFLKGIPFQEEYKELSMFIRFYNECIIPKNLKFYDAEKIIELKQHNIA
jgi:nucleoid DNA-binding protein